MYFLSLANPTNMADKFWPREMIQFSEVLRVSAINRDGTEDLKKRLRHHLDVLDDAKRQADGIVPYQQEILNKLTEHHKGNRLV